jgi:hypothetical protein
MRARPEVALRSSSPGVAARRKIVSAVLSGLAFGSLYSGALAADSAPRYPPFAIKSYLGRCLAAQAPATTLVIADCNNAADQAFGVEELDPDHRVKLHLAEQCVGAQATAADAAVRGGGRASGACRRRTPAVAHSYRGVNFARRAVARSAGAVP